MKKGSYLIGFVVGAAYTTILWIGMQYMNTTVEGVLFFLLALVLVVVVNIVLSMEVLAE